MIKQLRIYCLPMLVILGGHGGIYHATYALHVSCFSFCDDVMYQSVPSLTISPPPRQNPGNFLIGKFPTPGKKRDPNPHPRVYKNELKPHHRERFPQLFTIKTLKNETEIM